MSMTRELCVRLSKITIQSKRDCSKIARDFRDVPSPRELPIIGTRLAILAAGSSKYLHEYVDKRHRELGPIYRERLGPVTGVFVSDPDSIRSIFSQEGKYPIHVIPEAWTLFNQKHNYDRGLFFMNGQEWLDTRRIMNNLLLKGDMSWMEEAADAVITGFLEDLGKNGSLRTSLDSEFYQVFLEVIVSVLLGADTYRKHRDVIQQRVNHLAQSVQLVFETTMKLELLKVKWAEKLGLKRWKHFELSMMNALSGTARMLERLTEECGHGNGLMEMLRANNLSEDRINAIVTDLFLAAADTTAYTMQWMVYMVTKNQNIQDELRSQLGDPESRYLKNTLKETLRLYPVAPFITRFLTHESCISGYRIPANTLIVMSIYSTGRDERYFDNPLEFLPERWNRENKSRVTRQASLPFAMGSRSCVGKKLAEYELQTMLSQLVENFKIELLNTKEIRMVMKMIAAPSEPIRLNLKKI
ncbi:cytochrome P450 315a1, mitochondrial-like [Harmonia axyridis]|uniref:cytochrome P450 315a1, mitochondrial-like n=1 Tax=Harmonia axyridis TaxID=115357 RepID=UPI001E279C0A|nr:cytochrome P450 315a1, mitochondrial-like [Harmonia axyridis]